MPCAACTRRRRSRSIRRHGFAMSPLPVDTTSSDDPPHLRLSRVVLPMSTATPSSFPPPVPSTVDRPHSATTPPAAQSVPSSTPPDRDSPPRRVAPRPPTEGPRQSRRLYLKKMKRDRLREEIPDGSVYTDVFDPQAQPYRSLVGRKTARKSGSGIPPPKKPRK